MPVSRELLNEAKEAVLSQIMDTNLRPGDVLNLAEAYAWLTSPSQPHGEPKPAPQK